MKLKKELLVLERPFFHLYIGEENDFKSLYLLYKEKSNKDNIVRFIEGSKCNSLNNIFSEFAKAFQFPNYFGNNWQALDECLNDLDWLSGNAYLLFISNIIKIMRKEDHFRVLLKILVRSVIEWTTGRNYDDFPTPPTPFHIIFQCSKKNKYEVERKIKMLGLKDINILSN